MTSTAFFSRLHHQSNPLAALHTFLERERQYEIAQQVDAMRFVGYVLDIGYSNATIITSDPFKKAVGGIPRGSFLILAPSELDDLPPHFSLLRVMETAPTPLGQQVQQTYFELHKKSMPELDIWTQSELQWGALKCDVLGMFYPDPDNREMIAFAGDVNNVVSAHRYMVFAPDAELLDIIVNGLVSGGDLPTTVLGKLRPTESRLSELISPQVGGTTVDVRIAIDDFAGTRTAMFGKTRLGKSNVVKLIAQGVLDATASSKTKVGQLIFDVNGEYANDNEWDGIDPGTAKSLRSAYADRCIVYALTPRVSTASRPLRLNFYEQPESCIQILAGFLTADNKTSIYMKAFGAVTLPQLEDVAGLSGGDQVRAVRKIQMYWAILKRAGFIADESRLLDFKLDSMQAKNFDPGFAQELRANAGITTGAPTTLAQLATELSLVEEYRRGNSKNKLFKTSSGNDLFDAEDLALLGFLAPKSGSAGPVVLSSYKTFHSADADDFVSETLDALDAGKTVILDLGNATDLIRRYFADHLSRQVFSHQEAKFSDDRLRHHFVQLYFEEAHNLFPIDDRGFTGVYARFAKEGAKFHIGIVYSTQSPTTINRELLTQTENFFVGHLSSDFEVSALAKLQRAFVGVQEEIMRSRTPGYMRMLTRSHRFVIPVQARKFAV